MKIKYFLIFCTVFFLFVSAAWSHEGEKMDTIPKLGSLKNYKDWVVGCDNIKACSAVLLKPETNTTDGPNITITKAVGDKPFLHIDIYNLRNPKAGYNIMIDGADIAVTGILLEDETLRITGKDADLLAQAMARGYEMQLQSFDIEKFTVSLAGTMAAMLYIDEQQETYNTDTALVAKGSNIYIASVIQPKINVQKIGKLYEIPSVEDIVMLSQTSGCDQAQFGVSEDRAFSLGKQGDTSLALVIISCGSGAYNFSSAPYIGRLDNDKWVFEPARFDYDSAVITSEVGAPVLINVNWDKNTQILSSIHKGRGLGDCGGSADYVWNGNMFRLVMATSMDPCRGAWDWIRLWQAQVIYIEA